MFTTSASMASIASCCAASQSVILASCGANFVISSPAVVFPPCCPRARLATCAIEGASIELQAAHARVLAHPRHHLAHQRPPLSGIRHLFDLVTAPPALAHGDAPHAGLDHAPGDVLRLLAGEINDRGRDPLWIAHRLLRI